ncbi:MAG: hypothetical protein ABJ314_19060, partial [Ilumatobacter sp.]
MPAIGSLPSPRLTLRRPRRSAVAALTAISLLSGATVATVVLTDQLASPPVAQALDAPIDFTQPLSDDSRRGTYLGSLDDQPDVFVSITTDEGLVRIYICDGDEFGHWFAGEVFANSFDITTPTGGRVTGAFANGRAVGLFHATDGTVSSFTASLPEGDGGVFRADQTVGDQRVVAGWIVQDDGDVRGVSTVVAPDGTTVTEPAPEVDATDLRVDPTQTIPVVDEVPVVE